MDENSVDLSTPFDACTIDDITAFHAFPWLLTLPQCSGVQPLDISINLCSDAFNPNKCTVTFWHSSCSHSQAPHRRDYSRDLAPQRSRYQSRLVVVCPFQAPFFNWPIVTLYILSPALVVQVGSECLQQWGPWCVAGVTYHWVCDRFLLVLSCSGRHW